MFSCITDPHSPIRSSPHGTVRSSPHVTVRPSFHGTVRSTLHVRSSLHGTVKSSLRVCASDGNLSNSVHWPPVSSSVLGVSRFPFLLLSFVGMSSHYLASVYSSLCSSDLHWAGVIPLSHSECWDYRHMPTYLLLSVVSIPLFWILLPILSMTWLPDFVFATFILHPVSPTTNFYFSIPVAGSLDVSGQCAKKPLRFIYSAGIKLRILAQTRASQLRLRTEI